MDKTSDYDKLYELHFHGIPYLLHLKTNSNSLTIELEEKYQGQIWSSVLTSQQIQIMTKKAGNFKKYPVFAKMLIASLEQTSDAVFLDLLSSEQIQKQKSRKVSAPRSSTQHSKQKKWLILRYQSQFDQISYPLGIKYIDNPQTDRLKAIIRRLSSQLKLYQSEISNQGIRKQISLLKYENQTLKAKIQNNMDISQSRNRKQNENLENISQEELKRKTQEAIEINEKCKKFQQENAQLKEKIKQAQQQLTSLREKLKSYEQQLQEKQRSSALIEKYKDFQEKVAQMNSQTVQLVSELQHARQKEKKDKLRIENLQKQLQTMISKNQTKVTHQYQPRKKIVTPASSNRKSLSQRSFDQRSQKSQKSQKSNASNTSKGMNIKSKLENYKKSLNNKKISVYDSDTESSRMRRMNNNRVSPYRQPTKLTSNNKSGNKKGTKYTLKQELQRSRSKSAKKKIIVPAYTEEALASETGFISDSDSQSKKISQTLAQLRQQRKHLATANENKKRHTANPDNCQRTSTLEKKINSIAELLRSNNLRN